MSFGLIPYGVAIIRRAVALWLLSAVLVYWLGDFNTYADISDREYVIAQPAATIRLAYSAGLGMACASIAGAAVWAVGRNGWLRWLTLVVVYTAVLYAGADLNMYVVGLGPEGQDWVKNRSEWGPERLLECAVLGGVVGTIGWVVAEMQGHSNQGRLNQALHLPRQTATAGNVSQRAVRRGRDSRAR